MKLIESVFNIIKFKSKALHSCFVIHTCLVAVTCSGDEGSKGGGGGVGGWFFSSEQTFCEDPSLSGLSSESDSFGLLSKSLRNLSMWSIVLEI